ncbi:unnamed protein product [Cuscuta epithymum]|uniref:Uncharacterized protein n=1 Tax=Cuscuta epithymum TaxID=186058 RepID=A0AAV0CIU6_9ASTE|nr:unnamed protein product [Cuscuta epithymum]
MRALQRLIRTHLLAKPISVSLFSSFRPFSSGIDTESSWSSHFGDSGSTDVFDWDAQSSFWSTGLTKEHFDGEIVGRKIGPDTKPPNTISGSTRWTDEELNMVKQLREENLSGKAFADKSMREMKFSVKQVRKPRVFLKDSQKTEMYKKHKENPDVYTVESLAKEYGILRQRVHAILWLKELEEEEEKKLACPRDDSIDILLDTCPEFFNSHDREFEVPSIPFKKYFEVMPEGWDGMTRDPDDGYCETSIREEEMIYQDFVQRFNCNKMKMAKKHKYNRRHAAHTRNYTDDKLGPPRNQQSQDGMGLFYGSSYPLYELRRIFMKRKSPRRSRKIRL